MSKENRIKEILQSVIHRRKLGEEVQEPDGSLWQRDAGEKIWWLLTDSYGDMIFSFDRNKRFDMWVDYPDKLTLEEKEIFDRENPDFAIPQYNDGDFSHNE